MLTKITQLSLNMHSRLAMHILINSIWKGWLEKEKSIDIIYYQDYNVPSLTVEKVKSARKPLFKV